MVSEFVYTQPVKLFFGQGKFKELGSILTSLGVERCIIVCGKHFAAQAEALTANNQKVCGIYGSVEQNSQLSGAVAAAKLATEAKADTILGIGGGSSIDTAKFASAIAKGTATAEEYYYGQCPFPTERLNIIAVPTTAGTGSEVTQVAVINNGKEKKTINNPVFMPTAAIVDAELSCTVPPKVTMTTGLDALAHALEGYWSINHQPIPDLMAIEAVRLIMENLELAYLDGKNMTARSNMAYASMLAGMAFALPKTAACHACSYPLSEDYHLSHGEACAFTLDSFVRINVDERLELLCQRAGIGSTQELSSKIQFLKNLAGLKSNLSDLGNVDINRLSHDCAAHPLMKNNPVSMDAAKLHQMFEALK